MKRFGGQLRWIEKRKRWRLDWCAKFQGSFHTREEAEAKLEVLKADHQATVRAAEIVKFGGIPLRVCTRCSVKKPEVAFGTIVLKSTGKSHAATHCIDCRTKDNAFRKAPRQKKVTNARLNTSEHKEKVKAQNQKPDGKRKRALLQKLPESKKRRKENPPPSAALEKVREYSNRHRRTPGFVARTTSMQFRLKQSLQAKMRAVLHGRIRGDDLTKLGGICPWVQDEEDLVEHFRLKLDTGMTMENYGTFWSIAHVIPAAYYDLLDLEDVQRCNSQANLGCDYVVPGGDELTNSEKGSKLPTDDVMIAQGAASWPKSWNDALPSPSDRIKLQELAHAGKLHSRKHVGQMDIRMFVRGC